MTSFSEEFYAEFKRLLAWRRDVRRFKTDPLTPGLLDEILDVACTAPSVGNSRPWRFVSVESSESRAAIREAFIAANDRASQIYDSEKRKLYQSLKLSGLNDAPEQIAVYCDTNPAEGGGLGRQTMPETLAYSAVCAIYTMWLAARAKGVGMGWVSIIDTARVNEILQTPACWRLIGYFCIGYPLRPSLTPELEEAGWQDRTAHCRQVKVV